MISAIPPIARIAISGTHVIRVPVETTSLFGISFTLLDQLREEYDYIIIDTPPVLLLSDALALSAAVDGAVLVCRHQVSYISDIERALDVLKFSKVNVLGVIINDYKAPKSQGYYGGYHGYGYKKYYYYHSYAYDTREYKASDAADQDETETDDSQP